MGLPVGARLELVRRRSIDDDDGKWDSGELLDLADAARLPGTDRFEAEGRRGLLETWRKARDREFVGDAKRTLRSILIDQARIAESELDATSSEPLHALRTFFAGGVEVHTHDSSITEAHAARVGAIAAQVRGVFPTLAWPELKVGLTQTARGFYTIGPVILAAVECEPPSFSPSPAPGAPRIGPPHSERFLVHEFGHSLFVERARGRLDLELEGAEFGAEGLVDLLFELNAKDLDPDRRSAIESAAAELQESRVPKAKLDLIRRSGPYQELVADLVAALVYRDPDVLTPGLVALGAGAPSIPRRTQASPGSTRPTGWTRPSTRRWRRFEPGSASGSCPRRSRAAGASGCSRK